MTWVWPVYFHKAWHMGLPCFGLRGGKNINLSDMLSDGVACICSSAWHVHLSCGSASRRGCCRSVCPQPYHSLSLPLQDYINKVQVAVCHGSGWLLLFEMLSPKAAELLCCATNVSSMRAVVEQLRQGPAWQVSWQELMGKSYTCLGWWLSVGRSLGGYRFISILQLCVGL